MSTIGSSAPSQHTINYDSLLSTTFMAYRPKMVDNIYKSNAFIAALKRYGATEYQNGGERIMQPLMYGENDTFKSFRGYDPLTVKPQEGMTSAFFEWGMIGGTVSISYEEERKNSGEAAMLRLLDKKILQAELSAKGKLNSMLLAGSISGTEFVPGNGAKDLLPLGYFLPKDCTANPAAGGNVGNISRVTESWWRPNTAVFDNAATDTGNSFAMAVTTYKGLMRALKRMYNQCSKGGDGSAPNLLVVDQVTYETYESALDEKIRYSDTKMADMGFDTIKMKGATMIWDELVPDIDQGLAAGAATFTGTAFFLNTNYYKLTIDTQTEWITTPFVAPENQAAKTSKILFMGQTNISNYRKLGVCYAISQSIVA